MAVTLQALKGLIQTYLLAQWGQFTSHQASLGHHPVSMGTHEFSSALTGTHWLSMALNGSNWTNEILQLFDIYPQQW